MPGKSHFRPDEHVDDYDDDFDGAQSRAYAFGRSRTDYGSGDSVPLFLSDPDGEPDPAEYASTLRRHSGAAISLRILMGVLAASGVAMLFAWFTSDATRDLLISAKASISTMLPVPSAAAQPDSSPPPPVSTQLTARDVQLKDPARWKGQSAQTTPPRASVVAMAPSREDISSAYQSAMQNRAPAAAPAVSTPPAVTAAPAVPAAPPAPVVAAAPAAAAPAPAAATPPPATPPARRIDAEELALLMKRAKDLLASGDIPPARLLLRRAADAEDPAAALMLAQTYDPQVLGTQDVRNINPDPELARNWYQRAAQLGSADAQRRLAQMQN
jgi:hypothetical protein